MMENITTSKKKLIKNSLLIIVFILVAFAVGKYVQYKNINDGLVHIGSIQKSKEVDYIYGFEDSESDLLGDTFFEVFDYFGEYLKENKVIIDDTILQGLYSYTTGNSEFHIRYLSADESYNFIVFYFNSNNTLTDISTNGFVGAYDVEKQSLENTNKGYKIETGLFEEDPSTTQTKIIFEMQTGDFFDYLSSNVDTTPKEFAQFVEANLIELED